MTVYAVVGVANVLRMSAVPAPELKGRTFQTSLPAPDSAALIAEHRAALPPPITKTSMSRKSFAPSKLPGVISVALSYLLGANSATVLVNRILELLLLRVLFGEQGRSQA